jgi:hypothetical protein
MRVHTVLLLAGLVFACSVMAQEPAAQPAPRPNAPQFREEDGGVNLRMESIVVSSKAQAPFTLTLETEWARPLADGGSITSVNKRRIARDAAGRIYQERWFLVPKNGNVESKMTTIQIADPQAHTLYNCFFFGDKKNVCEELDYSPSEPAVNTEQKDLTVQLADNRGSYTHHFLGKQMVSGVETVGVRDTTTFNPGVFGNDREMVVERETWYSPQLDLNLLSIRTDPRTGKQTFTATVVIQGDPDPALFELPAGFRAEDHRVAPAAAGPGN